MGPIKPTTIGVVVTNYLKENFPNIVDISFTSNIESEFDKIAQGKTNWTTIMHNFYDNFVENVKSKEGSDRVSYVKSEELGTDNNGNRIYAKEGQHGVYIQLGDSLDKDGNKIKPIKISTVPKGVDVKDITLEKANYYLRVPRVLGKVNDKDVVVNVGRFGPYLLCNNTYYNIKPEYDINIYEVSIDRAKEIINNVDSERANSVIKSYNDDSYGDIKILRGKYGVYISVSGVKNKHSKGNYKIVGNLTEEEASKLNKEEVINMIKSQNNSSKTKKKKR